MEKHGRNNNEMGTTPVSKLTISHGACISSFCLLSSPTFSIFLFWSKAQAINAIWRLCTEEPHQCNHVLETFPSQLKRLKLWSGYCKMNFVWSFTFPHIRRSLNNHLIITIHPWNYNQQLVYRFDLFSFMHHVVLLSIVYPCWYSMHRLIMLTHVYILFQCFYYYK